MVIKVLNSRIRLQVFEEHDGGDEQPVPIISVHEIKTDIKILTLMKIMEFIELLKNRK